MNRRDLLRSGALLAAPQAARPAPERKFRISLAEWSIHRAIRNRFITNLDFPRIAREQFGIEGLEFVNQLWEAPTQDYIRKLKSNARSTATQPVLIMCDAEGAMGAAVKQDRMKAAANHYKWVDIAAELGCHSIRTNMYPDPEPQSPAEVDAFIGYCAESFNNLCEYAKRQGLNVIIENHGGLSSDPDIVIRLMKMVNLPNFGTLPDFGNFPKTADRYSAIAKLLTYAKGVSFKCFDFDDAGRETTMDMDRIMKSVLDSSYHNWVGIEYEGNRQTEFEGVQAGKRYLDRLLAQS